MFENTHSFLSPKLEVRPAGGAAGFGVFAREPIARGELAAIWSGFIVNYEQLQDLPPDILMHTIQVEDDFYLASLTPDEPTDFINHSCDPNLGIAGQLTLVAMRDIQPGEQVGFDYATADSTPYDEFLCECGAANCRGRVSGNDWKNPDLWERYQAHFMPYLLRRIERLKHRLPVVRQNGYSRTPGLEIEAGLDTGPDLLSIHTR